MKRYNIDKIMSVGAEINLIYGERTNGKSYQAKHKLMVEHFLKTGEKFILLRRWKDEITNSKINEYFTDIDVMKITNNKYDSIIMYQRHLYFATVDDNFKVHRGDHIGYVMVLSQEQIYASVSILDVENIVYEEFFSRTMYLPDEANKLMNLYNTIDRKRGKCKLWLIGNTISRTNPILKSWGLFDYLVKQKQGTIITIDKCVNGYEFKIAMEYCESTGNVGLALGDNAAMINTGAWQTSPEPHLEESHLKSKLIIRIVFSFQHFTFLAELRKHKTKSYVWFIYPKYTPIKTNTIVICDTPNESPYMQGDIYNFKYSARLNKLFRETFVENKIFYATDLCGNEFKSVIPFLIKK
ncbi:MAG: phage DNA encapsidation protein [Lachnospiraceae bacterium]|nr:phage DNA encapsidation protein [Lachnospiraceae bacterium]MCM1232729.1 phage DNA encapsidation protein [Ruminococcus flavefaciens]